MVLRACSVSACWLACNLSCISLFTQNSFCPFGENRAPELTGSFRLCCLYRDSASLIEFRYCVPPIFLLMYTLWGYELLEPQESKINSQPFSGTSYRLHLLERTTERLRGCSVYPGNSVLSILSPEFSFCPENKHTSLVYYRRESRFYNPSESKKGANYNTLFLKCQEKS